MFITVMTKSLESFNVLTPNQNEKLDLHIRKKGKFSVIVSRRDSLERERVREQKTGFTRV